MTRPKERIDRILEKLEDHWKEYPDLRIGQIVANAYSYNYPANHGGDPFHMEDSEFEYYLDADRKSLSPQEWMDKDVEENKEAYQKMGEVDLEDD